MSVLGYSRIENHKDFASRVNGHRSHSTYILQRKFWKNTKETIKNHYFEILSCKTNSQAHNDLALPSWGRNESFDTHMSCVRWQVRQIWHFWHFVINDEFACTICHFYICHYGCQEMHKDLRNTERRPRSLKNLWMGLTA